MREGSLVLLLWIAGGAFMIICLMVLVRRWIADVFSERKTVSRHSAWVEMVQHLPAGGRLTGAEPDGWTIVDFSQVAGHSQECWGGR
jgi:hypothetical protein